MGVSLIYRGLDSIICNETLLFPNLILKYKKCLTLCNLQSQNTRNIQFD